MAGIFPPIIVLLRYINFVKDTLSALILVLDIVVSNPK